MKTRKYFILICLICLCILLSLFELKLLKMKKDNLEIDIGFQSGTSELWGALVMKNGNILQKNLEKKFPNTNIIIKWHDHQSGADINAQMISGNYQIGFLGDMPTLINGSKSKELDNYRSKLIAKDGVGVRGKNQAIIVNNHSHIKKINDLDGKSISAPFGSSAHKLVNDVMKQKQIKVNVSHQDVSSALIMLNNEKTYAFSVWEPYVSILASEPNLRVLYDGSNTGKDYLTGIVFSDDLLRKDVAIKKEFVRSLNESHKIIENDTDYACNLIFQETGIKKKIIRKIISNIKWESKITDKDINNYKDIISYLVDKKQINYFDIDKFNFK